MAFTSLALRRILLRDAKPLSLLYSTAAKSDIPQGATAGKDFLGMFSMKRIKKNWEGNLRLLTTNDAHLLLGGTLLGFMKAVLEFLKMATFFALNMGSGSVSQGTDFRNLSSSIAREN